MTMVWFRRILILASGVIAWVSFALPGFAAEVSGARSLETMEEIDRQLESDPLSEKYLISKARLLFDRKEYRGVIETLRPVLVRNPKSIDALEGTAKAYIHLNECGHAKDLLNQLIELRPCFNYYFLRGHCNSKVGCYKKALEDNDCCIRFFPKEADAYVQRAELHRKQFGLDEQCEKFMRKAKELAPNDPVIKAEWEEFSNLFAQKAKTLRHPG